MDNVDKFLEAIAMDSTGITSQWISLGSILNLLMAAVFGFLILLVYFRATGRGRHDENLRMVIPVLTILMAVIMRTEGARIVLFFGIFGILSIVQFRSSLTDQRGITFILFSVIEGLLIGVNNYMLAALSFLVVTSAVILGLSAFKQRQYAILSLRFSGEAAEAKKILEELLDELGQSYRFLGYALDAGADKAGEPRARRRLRYELQEAEEGSILVRTGRLEEEATARGWKVRIRKA